MTNVFRETVSTMPKQLFFPKERQNDELLDKFNTYINDQ